MHKPETINEYRELRELRRRQKNAEALYVNLFILTIWAIVMLYAYRFLEDVR